MSDKTEVRQINLADLKAILIDPFQALAISSLSDETFITTNGQGDGLIEIIEQVKIPCELDETLEGWLDENIIYLGNAKTAEPILETAQYCDIWRDCYAEQPASAATKAAELGLAELSA